MSRSRPCLTGCQRATGGIEGFGYRWVQALFISGYLNPVDINFPGFSTLGNDAWTPEDCEAAARIGAD